MSSTGVGDWKEGRGYDKGRMKTVQWRKNKDGLLHEAGPLWIGFVFALYRATMSRQW